MVYKVGYRDLEGVWKYTYIADSNISKTLDTLVHNNKIERVSVTRIKSLIRSLESEEMENE